MSGTLMTRLADESQFVLASILDQNQDAILLLDRDGAIEFMSRSAYEAMDVTGSAIGSPLKDLFAGPARKHVAKSVGGALSGQRSRFELDNPSQGDPPKWWEAQVSPVYDQDGQFAHVVVIMSEVTAYVTDRLRDRRKREQAERDAGIAEDVAREMRHRLKNQLAVIGSVARLLSRHSSTADALYEKLEGKLAALARAQDLLTVSRDEPVALSDAVGQIVNASGAGQMIEVGVLADACLSDSAVQHLALILGELQTNSLKYGALNTNGGRVRLHAEISAGCIAVQWIEDVGSVIARPERFGSGTTLVNRLGSVDGNAAHFEWHQTGLSVTFYLRMA